MNDNRQIVHTVKEQLRPPSERIPVFRWLKENLFSSWLNAILTIVSTVLIAIVVFGLFKWALGARWEVIPANLKLLLVGTYPVEYLWRVWTTGYIIAFLLGFSSGSHGGLMRRVSTVVALVSVLLAILPFPWGTRGWLFGIAVAAAVGFGLGHLSKGIRWCKRLEIAAWLLSFPISLVLLNGLGGILPVIGRRTTWGFLLNLIGAVVGIGLSFPIGVLLALGVPLISLLFMASIMLQLLLPANVRPDLLIRAMMTITAFSAAYMAENVRGGLQAIPRGQYEAASAVGLNKALITILIILPQALRLVIPAIVGQFIALFMDTTLFGFIAILELLNITRSIMGNIEWRGTIFELYVFIGIVFWILCYSMSYVSRRIEKTLGVGER
jgi:general L-amino acid transport system permease protein